MEGDRPTVLITGITGFVGSQVCYTFLKNGGFKVKGTVRSVSNTSKMDPIKAALGEELFSQIELVEADLMNEESLINACEGCTYIVHTASPFPIKTPNHEDDLIKPAVQGTLAALKGAEKHGAKRVVITSSVAAVASKDPALKQTHYSEEDWSDTDHCVAYSKSKTLAEKAAWDFIANLPEDKKFDLVTVNPGLITGPNFNTCNFSSGDIIKKFVDGSMPMYPLLSFTCVDVRDVAEAHLQAILKPEAAGRRFLMAQGSYWMQDLAQFLRDKYGTSYPIPTRQAPYFVLYLMSWFQSELSHAVSNWGKQSVMDNTPAKEVLGINFIPMDQSIPEMAEALIKTGYIDPPKNK